jgi:hypothetical protein
MPLRIRPAQDHAPRLGRGVPMQEDHQAPATLQRLGPPHGGREMQRRFRGPRAAGLDTMQGLAGDLPSLLAPRPTALRVRTGGETHAGGVTAPWGHGVPLAADDFSNIGLLRLGAIHTRLAETRWQAMPMRAQGRRGAVDPGCCRLRLRGVLARRRLCNSEGAFGDSYAFRSRCRWRSNTRSKVPLYLAQRSANISLPLHSYHHAPERLSRT